MTDLSDLEIEKRIRDVHSTLGSIGFEQLVQFARQCGLDGAKSAVDVSIRSYVKTPEASAPQTDPSMLMATLQTHIRHHGNQVLDYGVPGPGSF